MDESQNSGKKPQLSWAQPVSSIKPTQMKSSQNPPIGSGETRTNSASAPARSDHTMRNLIIAIVAILVVMGIAWAITGNKKDSDAVSDTTPSKTAGKPSSAAVSGTPSSTAQASFPSGPLVITSPQNAGLEIAVSNVAVQVPTWVVIYENYNGQPGNVLGAALFTKDRSSGAVDLLRGTLPGQSYFAGEARDDGDHMFSMANDPATRDANGNPITLKFETK
ncbi:hypothetical protein K2Q00_01925 [Patescibacteria group bacterium]|nr:hypothetical protein [Patescibacteria group bacterium]